jgi:hypothetical protein
MWSVILCALSVALSLFALVISLYAARTANRLSAWRRANKESRASELQSLRDLIDEQGRALLEVANRVKMQRVRNAANHVRGSQGEPDARTDPDAWRNWKNAQLRNGSTMNV